MLQKKMLATGIVVVLAVLVISFSWYLGSQNDSSSGGLVLVPPSPTNGSSPGMVSLSELALHHTLEDCWIGYDGKAYDITSFLPKHPGTPQAILPYCGTAQEFEQAFTKQHGTTKVAMLMRVGVLMGDLEYQGQLQ